MVTIMIGSVIKRDGERTALAVLLACCLLVQTIVTGTGAAPASDLFSELSVICASHGGGGDADQPAGQSSLPDKSCLVHCLGAIASGTPVTIHALALPGFLHLTRAEVGPTDQMVRNALARTGLGARAPPSIIV